MSGRNLLNFQITVANYEYIFAWKLDQAAGLSLETRATGILSTAAILPGETSPYGNVVSPGYVIPCRCTGRSSDFAVCSLRIINISSPCVSTRVSMDTRTRSFRKTRSPCHTTRPTLQRTTSGAWATPSRRLLSRRLVGRMLRRRRTECSRCGHPIAVR